MHKTGHYIGMDVHDVGTYYQDGQPRPLEANMVITVEPGVYVAPSAEVPEQYRGIGIRIEDDVRVTSDASEVLSGSVPKSIQEVERACRA